MTSAVPPSAPLRARTSLRWAIVLGAGVFVALLPAPAGVTADSWGLFAVFVSTVLGLTVQPIPGGGVVLLGVAATALFGIHLTEGQTRDERHIARDERHNARGSKPEHAGSERENQIHFWHFALELREWRLEMHRSIPASDLMPQMDAS